MFLSFEDNNGRTCYSPYYPLLVEIKNYNVMIDGRNLFDQPVTNNSITYNNIRKIATDQGDNSATSCLLDYPYFKEYYKMVAKDLSK